MDAFEWLSLAVLLLSCVTLLLAIKSGPLEVDVDSLTDGPSKWLANPNA
jgi:hypothetical protein